jgi:hypothetical protein
MAETQPFAHEKSEGDHDYRRKNNNGDKAHPAPSLRLQSTLLRVRHSRRALPGISH